MPRSNIKYQIARGETDVSDYLSQNVQELQNVPKNGTPMLQKTFQMVVLISVYFVLSVGLTFYQQWLYNTYGFHFPLGVVVCHLVLKFVLSASIRYIKTWYSGQQQVKLSWQNVIWSLAPPGVASGLDVGLSNWGISLITVSLYTMTKSTTIIFILGFSLIFKLEKKSWSLVGIVVMISGGLIMFTYKSTQFGLFGFVLCLLASLSSGFRWTMAQIIMQKSKLGLRNPVDMMYYMQPWMLLPIVPVTLWFEGPALYNNIRDTNWTDTRAVLSTSFSVIGGAILAFNMEVMEFLVVTHTSSLTLSICGVVKEICILILAFEWKGDQMSGLNFIGLLMCLGGIILHVVQKVLTARNKTADNLEMQSSALTSNGSKNEDGMEINAPLLMQKSTSLTNLLNADFSSDEAGDCKEDEDSSQILSDILQRREQ